ncbi:MAG: ester cyclase [Acidobacteriota bacterium]
MRQKILVKNLFALVIALGVVGLALGCYPNTEAPEVEIPPMDPYLAIWNNGDLDLVDELYAPGFVWHVVDMGEDVVGTAAFKELVTGFRTAFPDFHVTFDEVLVAGDKTVIRWTMTGTNTGPLEGLPPSGQPVRLQGVAISRAVDGVTTEVWQYYNQLAMFQQMGFTLTPASAGETAGE